MSPPVVMGIIPARAGFTRRAVGGRRCPWDHPRSRGVYTRPSPLHSPEGRIIPARAGFTWTKRPSGSPTTDHPRSRGVYGEKGRRAISRSGSSPLARGLRWETRIVLKKEWIIPARAGFTTDHDRNRRPGRDHPRSRGVYPPSSSRSSPRGGSSPLARGLPGDSRYIQKFVGIIPARAGFTQDLGPGVLPAGDHPRSRGVYTAAEDGVRRELGSSPLARGLRARRIETRAGRGIIPARAGFTCLTRT